MVEDKQAPQLLSLLKKSQAFAEKLLTENEQLKLKLAALDERASAAESERDGLRDRIDGIHIDTSTAAQRFAEIDEELNALANLYIATWQLHSTLELNEVVSVLMEIVVNLIGADQSVIYLQDEQRGTLVPVSERSGAPANDVPFGEGPIGEAVASGRVVERPGEEPVVVVPLRLGDRTLGAIVIKSFFVQKEAITDLDRQLFGLMAEQGSTALYAAYLAGATAEKLSEDKIRAQLGS